MKRARWDSPPNGSGKWIPVVGKEYHVDQISGRSSAALS